MQTVQELLSAPPRVVNAGLPHFAAGLRDLAGGVVHLDWRPPAHGDPELVRILSDLDRRAESITAANTEAVRRMIEAQPIWVDVAPAGTAIPKMTPATILHSGPPVTWEQMCGPQRGSVAAALIFEGMASTYEEAAEVAASGRITLAPCHHFGAVGPMGGVISASMPVIVVENRSVGNRAYSTFNGEGRGSSHTMGLYGPPAQEMLRWVRDVLGPAMQQAVAPDGGIDLRALTARALQMGDECHNRHVASTSLITRALLPRLARARIPYGDLAEIGNFLVRNDWFFLNFSMAACKAMADSAAGVAGSTVVTAIARNGVETGIRISALGDRWFTAPAPLVRGMYFPGRTAAEANPDIGDSAITETCGIGAFAMAGAPAITQIVGGTVAEALRFTGRMREITIGENPQYTIPHLNFRGTPTGIDVRKVVETGITPVINTAIAHREPGGGMIGAGVVTVPFACFAAALKAYATQQYSVAPVA